MTADRGARSSSRWVSAPGAPSRSGGFLPRSSCCLPLPLVLVAAGQAGTDISGVASPAVGDTLKIGPERIRLDEQRSRVSPHSRLGEKLTYIANQWDGLLAFLHDGRVEMDSNFVENRIRPVKLTAKNALFAGHERPGRVPRKREAKRPSFTCDRRAFESQGWGDQSRHSNVGWSTKASIGRTVRTRAAMRRVAPLCSQPGERTTIGFATKC